MFKYKINLNLNEHVFIFLKAFMMLGLNYVSREMFCIGGLQHVNAHFDQNIYLAGNFGINTSPSCPI